MNCLHGIDEMCANCDPDLPPAQCVCATWVRTDGRLTAHNQRCEHFKEGRYVQISLDFGGTYTMPEDDLGVLLEEISEADIGSVWTLRLVKMTREEYERMPEFAGH